MQVPALSHISPFSKILEETFFRKAIETLLHELLIQSSNTVSEPILKIVNVKLSHARGSVNYILPNRYKEALS
jgi:hypothetical protein